MDSTNRNEDPLGKAKVLSKKAEEDKRWSQSHKKRPIIDDMAIDRILEEQIAEVWQYGEE